MIPEVEKAYAAGFVDGEGSIGINRHGNGKGGYYYQVSVAVVNTKRDILESLQSVWGGSIQNHPSGFHSKQQCWRLCLASKIADKFLTDIYPYLRGKKEQAKLARSFQELARQWKSKPRTAGYIEMQERIHAKVKQLNQRGLSSAHDGAPVESPEHPATQ